ncbi:unnamed protein product [Ectocarpus fasciculatus]
MLFKPLCSSNTSNRKSATDDGGRRREKQVSIKPNEQRASKKKRPDYIIILIDSIVHDGAKQHRRGRASDKSKQHQKPHRFCTKRPTLPIDIKKRKTKYRYAGTTFHTQ